MSSLAGEEKDSRDPPPYTKEPPNVDDLLKRPISKFDPPKLKSLSKKVVLPSTFPGIKPLDKKRDFDEAFEDDEPEPITRSEAEESMSLVPVKRYSRAI